MRVAELSSFISFELTNEEELLAYEYTELQMAGLQNELASSAEKLITVIMETDDLSLDGAKKLAYTKGQIDILKYLLARGECLKQDRLAEEEAKNQQ